MIDDKIKEIIDNHRRSFLVIIRNDQEIMKFLETYPEKLSSGGNYTIKTKLYWIYHGLTDFPVYVCPVDGVVHGVILTGLMNITDGCVIEKRQNISVC